MQTKSYGCMISQQSTKTMLLQHCILLVECINNRSGRIILSNFPTKVHSRFLFLSLSLCLSVFLFFQFFSYLFLSSFLFFPSFLSLSLTTVSPLDESLSNHSWGKASQVRSSTPYHSPGVLSMRSPIGLGPLESARNLNWSQLWDLR